MRNLISGPRPEWPAHARSGSTTRGRQSRLRITVAALVVAVLGIPASAQADGAQALAFTSLCGAMAGSHPSTV